MELETSLQKRKTAWYYWLQLLGWSGYFLYGYLTYSTASGGLVYSRYQLVATLIRAILGFAVTHLSRSFYHRSKLLQKKWSVQVPVFFVVISLQTMVVVIVSIWYRHFAGNIAYPTYDFHFLLYYISGPWIYFLNWLIFYLVFQFGFAFNKSQAEKDKQIIELQRLELDVLRLQLNPHFLFNTLNTIRSLINTDPPMARESTTLLSQLLRYTLNYEKNQLISLRLEADITEKYLSLEKMRFGDRLCYEIDISPEVLDIPVVPWTLMILAENAIKHGISKQAGIGEVLVRVWASEEHLHFLVLNSGRIDPTAEGAKMGIGISNLQRRLDLFYPASPPIQLKNTPENKVSAYIRVGR